MVVTIYLQIKHERVIYFKEDSIFYNTYHGIFT